MFGTRPFLVFGDDYAEISFPIGKHQIEVTAQTRGKEGEEEYGISIRYYEPGYLGGELRLNFIRMILHGLGFRFDQMPEMENQGVLVATLATGESKSYTEDKKGWEKKFAEVVRLLYALPDLDLHPHIAREAPRLFREGVTNFNVVMLWDVLREGLLPLSKVQEEVRSIFNRDNFFGKGERRYVAKRLFERAEGNLSKLNSYFDLLDEKGFDLAIEGFYDLAEEKYLQAARSLEALFARKFPETAK